MPAVLILPSGRKLDIDRIHADDGKLPVMGMMGGQKTLFERGSPPKPRLYQKGKAFFTMDEKPATEKAIQPWLDDEEFSEDIKGEMRAYLSGRTHGKAVTEKLSKIRPRKRVAKETRPFKPEDAGLSSKQPERV